jgi:hypothetical protein
MTFTDEHNAEAIRRENEFDERLRYTQISLETDFDVGEKFENEKEVRDYFIIQNFIKKWGDLYSSKEEWDCMAVELSHMADDVIKHRWHMKEGDERRGAEQ